MIKARYLTLSLTRMATAMVAVAGLSFAPASQAQIRFEITGVGAPWTICISPGRR